MRRQPAFSLSYAHQIMQPRLQAAFKPVPGVPKAMQDLIDRIGAPSAKALTAPSLAERLAALRELLDAEAAGGVATNH